MRNVNYSKQGSLSKPLVSIITAVYNGEKHLEQCIKSVISQNYDKIEYIIIDGGSTDDTPNIIKKYAEHITFWVSEPDKGIGDAWNKGIEKASGDIICFLNADDYYHPSTVQVAVPEIDIAKAQILYGITRFVDEYDYVVGTNKKAFRPERICSNFGFMHTTCICTRAAFDVVGPFNTAISIAVDTDWLVRAYIKNVEFKQGAHEVFMRIGGVSDRHKLEAFRQFMDILREHGFSESAVMKGYCNLRVKMFVRSLLDSEFACKLKTQLALIIIRGFNLVFNICPTHTFKKIVARAMGIKIGTQSYIHPKATFFTIRKLVLGNNSVINQGCYLDNRRGIFIGSNVSIAHGVKIYTLGHDVDDPFFRVEGKSVVIEDYAVIFANALIMPGVTVGKGAVVYPGSVVTKDVAPYTVVGGNPARVLRVRNNDLKYTLDYGYWFTT